MTDIHRKIADIHYQIEKLQHKLKILTEKTNRIVNLTGKPTTKWMKDLGVVEPDKELQASIQKVFSYDKKPTMQEVDERLIELGDMLRRKEIYRVLVGGPIWIQPLLVDHLADAGIDDILYVYKDKELISIYD